MRFRWTSTTVSADNFCSLVETDKEKFKTADTKINIREIVDIDADTKADIGFLFALAYII